MSIVNSSFFIITLIMGEINLRTRHSIERGSLLCGHIIPLAGGASGSIGKSCIILIAYIIIKVASDLNLSLRGLGIVSGL